MSRAIGKLSVVAVVITALLGAFGIVPRNALAVVVVVACAATYMHRRWVAFTTAAMFGVLIVAMLITFRLTWTNMKQPVGYPPPRNFPVLIVGTSPTGSVEKRVVYFSDLEAAKKTYASWTFLVPEKKAKNVKAQGSMWGPSFSVKEIEPGRQRFEVYGSPDDDDSNTSWYVATQQELFPEFHEYYGRRDQMETCATVPIVFLAWSVIAGATITYVSNRTGERDARSPQNNQA